MDFHFSPKTFLFVQFKLFNRICLCPPLYVLKILFIFPGKVTLNNNSARLFVLGIFLFFVWFMVISSFFESFIIKFWIISGISSNFLFSLSNLFIAVLMLLDLNINDILSLYSMYSFTSFLYCFNLNLFLSFSNLSFFRWFWFFILFVSVFFDLPFF